MEIQKAQMEFEARTQKVEADFAVAIAKVAEMQQETELKRQELELKAKEAHIRLNINREDQAFKNTLDTLKMAVEMLQQQAQNEQQQQQGQMQQEQQM